MAWNPSPEVAVARDAAKKLGDEQVIILRINRTKGTVGFVSYGETRALCDDAKLLGEVAYQAMYDELAARS